jgi:hypothetical protein
MYWLVENLKSPFSNIRRVPAGKKSNPYPTRNKIGSGTSKTHGSNFVSEPVPDGSDIRRISEHAGEIAIPTHVHITDHNNEKTRL